MEIPQAVWVSLGLIFVALSVEPVSAEHRKPLTATVLERTSLPMRFEENVGQTDGQVRFISRGPGYVLFLSPGEAVFKLSGHTLTPRILGNRFSVTRDRRSNLSTNQSLKSSVLRMRIEGARATPTIIGVDKLPGASNYFLGKDPSKWRTGIASYGKVEYSEVYSGVDLIYYGNQHQVEYDFVVNSGADPTQVSLAFDGAERMSMDSTSGDISIETAAGKMALRKPVIYQMENEQRKPVEGNYKFQANGRIAFDVKNYDRAAPLIIDPVLAYSTYIGGSFWDEPDGIAVDATGNAYITGEASSLDYPVVGTSLSTAPPTGGSTVFLSKINASGTALVYSTYLGGTSGNDYGWAVAVDGNGYAYVTGNTRSADFPVTSSSAYQTALGSGAVENGFVSKLSADGQSLFYSTYLGGDAYEYVGTIAVDTEENAYITGVTTSPDFPTTSNAIQRSLKSSNGNAFVSRIDTTKNGLDSLVYSTFLGGTSTEYLHEGGSAIAIDSQGGIYVSGWACSPDFPVTSSAYKTVGPSDSCSAFVSEIDTAQSGSDGLTYSTYFGGTDFGSTYDGANGLALDSSRMEHDRDSDKRGHRNQQGREKGHDRKPKVYVSGFSLASDFPTTTGATNGGAGKAFVAKFDTTKSSSDSLIYSTLFGSTSSPSGSDEQDRAYSVAADADGNAYLAGFTFGTDFPTTADAIQTTLGDGGISSFLTVVNQDASSLLYSTYWGGTNSASLSESLALDPSNNIYLVGLTESSNFETTTGSFQTSQPGVADGFVTKFAALPVPRISSLSPPCGPNGADIRINGLNFGSSQESSNVTFGAETVPIVSWSDTAIVAQVPAFAPFGSLQTTVTTALEPSNSEPFVVLSGHVDPGGRSHNGVECDERHRNCADWGDDPDCDSDTRRSDGRCSRAPC